MSAIEQILLRQAILNGLLLVGLFFAVIYAAFLCWRPSGTLKTLVKSIPLPAFAIGAATAFAAPLSITALALSAIGDIALSRTGQRAFLIGLGAFAAAHLAYALRFASLAEGTPALLPAAVLIGLALSTERWLVPHTGPLRWPVRVYVVLITAMGFTALALPADRIMGTIGAGLFIASDLVLAVQLFRMSEDTPLHRPVSIALWTLYIGGQLAILIGTAFAGPLFQI